MHPADPRVALLRDHLIGRDVQGSEGVRYYLRELIGEGGQGWIYKGNYDEADGVPIVIKVLRPDGMTEETLRRFRREATVLRQLGSQPNPNPNLVRFYDQGVLRIAPPQSPPNDQIELSFTVMEYVHGVTLADVIRDQGGRGLGAHRTRRLLRQASFAIASVHAQSITHRDLKPSNLLIAIDQGTEVVKVSDFGLAKLTDIGIQRTQMLAGATLGYAPPEQYEKGNDRVGPRTDVFSLAAILFECLSGSPAFGQRPGETALRSIERLISGPRPSLSLVQHALAPELRNPSLLAQLDLEIARATQPEPGDRHASIREFWDSVEPALRTASASVSVSSPPPIAALQPRAQSVNPAGEAAGGRIHFRSIGQFTRRDSLRIATVTSDRKQVFAVGASAFYRFGGGGWSEVPVPKWLDLALIQGVALLPDGAPLLYGERGTVIALTAHGEAQVWRLPDDDVKLYAAFIERAGLVLVGGRHSRPSGVCIEAKFGTPPRVREIPNCTVLRGVARLSDGALAACGDDGALIRIDGDRGGAIPWGRTGHLLAIAPRADGGAYAVGSGGHALSLSPRLQVTLEVVQTTRDLTSVAVAPDGTAWATATHRRILQRRGTTWGRVTLDVDMDETTSILAVQPSLDGVTAVAADGQILEGRHSS